MTAPSSTAVVRTCRVDGNRAELALDFPPDLKYFAGHFPGFPVLPAVAQVDVAIQFAKELLGVVGAFQTLKNLKFRKPILPGDQIDLLLEWQGAAGRLSFTFSSRGAPVSSGLIGFAH